MDAAHQQIDALLKAGVNAAAIEAALAALAGPPGIGGGAGDASPVRRRKWCTESSRTPSELGKHSKVVQYQQVDTTVWRPLFDTDRPYQPPPDVIPLRLMHPVFGQFLDDVRSSERPAQKDIALVAKLASALECHYDEEDIMMEAVFPVLREWLPGMPLTPRTYGTSERDPRDDGSIVVALPTSGCLQNLLTFEAKVTMDGSLHQSAAFAKRSFDMMMRKDGSIPAEDAAFWPFPSLSVGLSGNDMRVSGTAMTGTSGGISVRVSNLTPLLTVTHREDEMQTHAVARVLAATRRAVHTLREFYACAPETPLLSAVPSLPLPYALLAGFDACQYLIKEKLLWRAFARGVGENGNVSVGGSKQAPAPGVGGGGEERCAGSGHPLGVIGGVGGGEERGAGHPLGVGLKVATGCMGDELVVKFSEKYSSKVHHLWADKGMAPELAPCSGKLPGGYYMAAMECLAPPQWRVVSDLSAADLVQAKAAALKALQDAPKVDGVWTVHGDCRSDNAVSDGNVVKFLDFEWAGVERGAGVVYPDFINVEVFPDFARPGEPILHEHDVQVVQSWAPRAIAANDGDTT